MAICDKNWAYQTRTDLPEEEPKRDTGYTSDTIACWWARQLDKMTEQSALAQEFKQQRKNADTEQLRPSQMKASRFKLLRSTWTQDSATPSTFGHTRTGSEGSIPLVEETRRQESILESWQPPSPQKSQAPLTITTGPIHRPKKPGRPPKKRPPLQEPPAPREWKAQTDEFQSNSSTIKATPFQHTRKRVSAVFTFTNISQPPPAPLPPSVNSSEPLFQQKSPQEPPKTISSTDDESTLSALFRCFIYDSDDHNEPKQEPPPNPSTWEKVADLAQSTWTNTCQSCRDLWDYLV